MHVKLPPEFWPLWDAKRAAMMATLQTVLERVRTMDPETPNTWKPPTVGETLETMIRHSEAIMSGSEAELMTMVYLDRCAEFWAPSALPQRLKERRLGEMVRRAHGIFPKDGLRQNRRQRRAKAK